MRDFDYSSADQAKKELAEGIVHLWLVGLVVNVPDSSFTDKYGFRYVSAYGDLAGEYYHNQIVEEYLDKRNGKGWERKLQAEWNAHTAEIQRQQDIGKFLGETSYEGGTIRCYRGMAVNIDNRTSIPDTLFLSSYSMCSAVGNLVSYWQGRFRTISLPSKKEMLVTDLFPESEILARLLSDTLVTNRLAGKKPGTLQELLNSIVAGCATDFSNLLRSFTFNDVDGDTVFVRFGLEYGCAPTRISDTRLRIPLRTPPQYKNMFQESKKLRLLYRLIDFD
jgi:hypothetical protein